MDKLSSTPSAESIIITRAANGWLVTMPKNENPMDEMGRHMASMMTNVMEHLDEEGRPHEYLAPPAAEIEPVPVQEHMYIFQTVDTMMLFLQHELTQ